MRKLNLWSAVSQDRWIQERMCQTGKLLTWELLSGVLIHCLNTHRSFISGLEYERCLFPGGCLAAFGYGLPWGRDCPYVAVWLTSASPRAPMFEPSLSALYVRSNSGNGNLLSRFPHWLLEQEPEVGDAFHPRRMVRGDTRGFSPLLSIRNSARGTSASKS